MSKGKDAPRPGTDYLIAVPVGVPGRLETWHFRVKADATKEDLQGVVKIFEAANRPAPDHELLKAITRVYMLCRAKKEGEGDIQLRLGLYVAEMRKWPGDCVLDACEKWVETNTFYPSWRELLDMVRHVGGARIFGLERARELLHKRS